MGGPANLIGAGRAVQAALDAVDGSIARRLGLNRQDLRCINLLDTGPLTVRQIGRRTGLTSGAVSAMVDRLEAAGFVRRMRLQRDRRSVSVELVAAKRLEIAQLYDQMIEAVEARFASIPTVQWDIAADAMLAFASACRVAETELDNGEG